LTGVLSTKPSLLRDKGFARYDLAQLLDLPDGDPSLRQLELAFDDLPCDPYLPHGRRYRRYGRAVMVPWNGDFSWIPPTPHPEWGEATTYYQGDYNPEYPGMVRRFPAIAAETRANPLLSRIIDFDFAETFWAPHQSDLPVHIGVHLVKLQVDRDDEWAASSPDCLHRDGEPFTFAHLFLRRNVVGGRNTIAAPEWVGRKPEELPPGSQLAELDLRRPLESYAVHDPRVSHYVGAIGKGTDPGPGVRAVILIDFTPMTPAI
jgi:hypothetical protein